MNIIYIVCIVTCLVVMIVLKVCSRDVRVARCIMAQERSEYLNRTLDKNQPEFRTPSSEFRIPNSELQTFPLSQAVKTRATSYTPGSDMISFRDTFEPWGLIMAQEKNQ
jgi:hypothetical protein